MVKINRLNPTHNHVEPPIESMQRGKIALALSIEQTRARLEFCVFGLLWLAAHDANDKDRKPKTKDVAELQAFVRLPYNPPFA
jgi:hypothetical protein